MAMATPFLIHFALGPFRAGVRLLALAGWPATFYMIILTDSRLGAVGFLLSFVLYVAVWAVMRWRHHRDSLFGPAITLAFPAIFGLFIAATFFVGRLRRMVWGGGEHQFSTDARTEQYTMGLEIIARNPFGHGIGMGAERLGFTNLAGVLTIDTYYLLIALEYGVLGFFVYYGMLLVGVGKAGQALYKAPTANRETMLLIPLAISTVIFIVIKSVFSQEANHPLIFMMLAAILALVSRHRPLPAERIAAMEPARATASAAKP
jgi:O-antigen ligase